MTTEPLTVADYQALERCYIPRDIADQAGLKRVNSLEGRRLVGRDRPGVAGDYAGLAIPYRVPWIRGVPLCRLRVDHPQRDGSNRLIRYFQAPGDGNHVYLAPGTADLLAERTVPIVITEGEKKCLALWNMARQSTPPAFLPISFPGVWNWKGKTGISTNSHGHRERETGPIADLERITWTGRKVTILFDANASTNREVAAARRQLAQELTRRGADVWIAELPPGDGINGCDDYLARFGIEALERVLEKSHHHNWREDLIKTGPKKDHIASLLSNAMMALRGAQEWAGVLAFNEFKMQHRAVLSTPWGYTGAWREVDDTLTAEWLQNHGVCVSKGTAADAVHAVSQDHPFHPVRDYLHGLVWDGSERMDHWLTTYLGAEDRPLYQAEGARWLISAVARILRPGAKADHALILIGIQGTLKSTALKALVPDETWFTDDTPVLDSKDSKQSTTGVWIIEFAELNSLLKSRHADVKAFLSRTTDRFRPPYGHHFGEFPRQCVFSGTVNHPEFNEDDTGGRRFWPVLCGKIQVKLLEQDRDQLWAEAVVRYHRKEPWWLDTDELNQLAAEEQDKCRQSDPWEPTVSSWLTGREEVTIEEILLGPLEMLKRDLKHTHAIRVGSILRLLGGQLSPGKRRPRRYQPPEGGW